MSTATLSKQDTARMIRDMEAEFEHHANAGDAAALSQSFYAEDAQLLPPNSPLAKGTTAIREFWTAFLAGKPADIKMETVDVTASGEMAYSVGTYRYTQAGVAHAGKYIVVYRKEGDGYKCVADSFSDNA